MNKHTPGPWEIKTETPYIPAQVWTDDGRLLADVYGETYEARKANAWIMAAAPDMYLALAKLVCPECTHELQHHLDRYGCEIELGDSEGYEGQTGHALPPCGCHENDLESFPDVVRAIHALRLARGESRG
jgi:hypothetical protein